VFAAETTTSPATRPAEPFFFIQMTDPQIGWQPLEEWRTAIKLANRLKPAFVVVTGDLLNRKAEADKLDPEEDAKQLRDFKDVAAQLDKSIPFYTLPGNHDVCNVPTAETLAWYEKNFGKLWYSFTHGDCFFVAMETDILKHPDHTKEYVQRELAWVRQALRSAVKDNYRHKIVFMHHSVFLKEPDEKEDYFSLPLPVRKELLDLFHATGVEAVFSGHLHKNAYAKDGKLELITSGSCGKTLGKDPVGFRIVKVLGDRIEHRYYGYDEMPEKVEMK
jgi:serine/threonine-protein phosphatase CPPED1